MVIFLRITARYRCYTVGDIENTHCKYPIPSKI